MLTVGLTGGIGSGKSTFAALLAECGAEVIDADAIGRAALGPGQPAWHSVVAQFGDEVLGVGMEIDRGALARIVFNNSERLAALNAILHPVIVQHIADILEMLATTDEIVVIDAALILDVGLGRGADVLVVVTAPEEVRRRRLREGRGMTLSDINARMGSQRDPDELVAEADIVVHNDGSPERLAQEADRVWKELQARAADKS